MVLVPTASRTVTPIAGSYSNGGCDACGESLIWPCKSPSRTEDFWLDASLEAVANNCSFVQFNYDVYFTDEVLSVESQIVNGNKCGLLVSAGTSGIYYAVRIFGIANDNRLFSWNVALPMLNEVANTPVNNSVLVNGGKLSFAGRTLPVAYGE